MPIGQVGRNTGGGGGSGSGDVNGPISATDDAVALFDGTSGEALKNSVVTIADSTGDIVTPGSMTTGSGGGTSGDIALSGSSSGTVHIAAPAAAGAGTFNPPVVASGTFSLGYLNIPQNSQSAAYGLVLEDAGKHILHPTADNNARTFTIPANASIAYPIGTAITIINQINTVTIAITTDTLTLFPGGTTGSRTLAAGNVATIVKVASTSWIITGTSGLT